MALAWKSDFDATKVRADELFLSGNILWGLDENEEIFQLFGVPYQPVTILIASDQTVVEAWAGLRDESDLRVALDDLISLSG